MKPRPRSSLDATLATAFAAQVAWDPDATALVLGGRSVSYAELDRSSNALAWVLRRHGVGTDVAVGIAVERGVDLVVALLAVVKAGGAYLPIELGVPAPRVATMLAAAEVRLVLATAETAAMPGLAGADVIRIDTEPTAPADEHCAPAEVSHPLSLAYVSFTSGSTGAPKGVAIPHRAVIRLVSDATFAPLGPGGRLLQLAPVSFDASTLEIWGALLTGATMVIAPPGPLGLPELAALLRTTGVTVVWLTAGLFEQLAAADIDALARVPVVLAGGDALNPDTVRAVLAAREGRPLVNGYGPTENTTFTTCYVMTDPDQVGSTVPIGSPIQHTTVQILDEAGQPVPVGAVGELYTGGAGLARGYAGAAAATARAFVPDPSEHGARLYRTGDLVRRRADGVLEFVGRQDDQVKIRGFRIEPGEVAAVLRSHPAVAQALVLVAGEGARRHLVAYVTPARATATDPTSADLIAFAASRLPGYLVPAAIVVVAALPLNANGKVDRAALPAPGRVDAGLPEVVAAQRTPTEGAVAGIVAGLLGDVPVGVEDDLFALGVTSLLAGRLALALAAEWPVTVSLADLFRARTVAAIAAMLDARAGQPGGQDAAAADPKPHTGSTPPTAPPIRPARRDHPIPLSLQQERVWFFEQLSPGNLAHNFQATVSLRGEVDATALRGALDEIVRRHEILRTAFVTVDGVATQRPVAAADAPLRVLDVPAEQAEEVIASELRTPFDLTRPPLARWLLLRHGGGENTLVQVEHHFVHDGWSFGTLLSELSVLYDAVAAGQPSPLPEPAIQYADYAIWQREWMRGDVLRAHVDHWTAQLADAPQLLELPADRPRPPVMSMRGAAPRITIPADLSRALRSFSRQHRVSLFSTMYAGFAALLYRHTGQSDLLVGTGAANRTQPGLQSVLGMIVNTVVLRTKVSGDMSFTDLLAQVQPTIIDALAWSDTPVDAVINAIGAVRHPSRTPLFQVMFSFHDSAVPDVDFGGLTGNVTERANGSAKCDLNVIVVPRAAQRLGRESRPEDDDLSLIWEYSTDLFDEATMSRMVAHYLTLVTAALTDPAGRIDRLPLLTSTESELLESFSGEPALPHDGTIAALFAAQVARDPAAPALRFGTRSMTYGELDRRSNALAWVLRRRGVSTDTAVGVAIERGPDLVVALLAVLKAGGAYLPIELGTPGPRITAMINAANARLVLVTTGSAAAIPALPGVDPIHIDPIHIDAIHIDTIHIDTIHTDSESVAAADEHTPPPETAHPLSLAYLSFTSGSTGVPKGVAVPQRAVIRLVSDPSFAPLGPGQRLLHLAPVAFDASTLEIWGALLTGATVVIAPPGPLGLPDIASLLRDADVTVAWLTAGLFHQLAETDIDAIAAIPTLLAGGDVLDPNTVRAVLAARHGRPLVNGYGPTENTTFTSCHVMTDPDQIGDSVPIGRPIQHTTVHILDHHGQPTPIGVAGELYTGGHGLARGYANSPAATARAFVPDPHGHGARLYRTGDLARWRPDGTLEFVGRVDDQVKIRGFRIEPNEVATTLRAHPAVRESVVLVAGEGAQRHLVAYVTPAEGVDRDTLRPSMLRDFLANRLPEYLVPTGFRAVDRLPLNANGKVDRAALPAPDRVRETTGPATPPRGATEERLAEAWRLLLPAGGPHGGEIGREDAFFALGGNSLLAARLMFRIREAFDVELPMAAFYAAPTLAACAAAIDKARSANRIAVGGQRPAAAPSTISRRDRSAFRVPGQRPARDEQPGPAMAATGTKAPTGLPPHLTRLTDDWALWRTVCLRAPGFPVHLLADLGDESLAGAADAVIAADPHARDRAGAAYDAEFPAALGRMSAALHRAANQPALREAVAWQNRHALTTGIDVLLRRGPAPARRNTQTRQHEALVASYVQRYCAKNDTIGFFGPVGWSRIDDDSGIRITHATAGHRLAARVTYLEGWAVQAIMAEHASALRPWLVPRRMPFVSVDGALLRVPLAPAVALSPAEAAVMRASDGIRDANAVAAAVLADPSAGLSEVEEVFAVLGRLADSHRLAWQIDVAPQDIRPEQSMRATLSRVTHHDGIREPAERALDELVAARDDVADAGGDAERVAKAMASLEATFTGLAGIPPTRRAGELYAGRTLAFEECLRGDTVRLGADTLDGIREALAMVLDGARWFTAACGAIYARHFGEAYRERAAALGSDVVPFADFWLIVNEALFGQPPRLIAPAVSALRQRWSAILDLPPHGRRIQLRAADLRERVASHFPARPLPWPVAMHHSPDLMIAGAQAAAGGPLTWVLGEVHPSLISSRYATWLALHDDPEAVRAAARHDLGAAVVWMAETAENGGARNRLSNVLASPGDLRLVFAHDSCGYDTATALVVGECDVIGSPAGLRVRRRDATFEGDLLSVIGDVISGAISNSFDLVPPGGHTPRVTIDDLVVVRERWTLPATDAVFADTASESTRYLQARSWALHHGLPRHVFIRFTGERKPIYADLTSLASIDLVSRSARRSRRSAGADATMTVVEMLPAPDEAWLTDAEGQRYTAELRLVARDQKMADQRREG